MNKIKKDATFHKGAVSKKIVPISFFKTVWRKAKIISFILRNKTIVKKNRLNKR